MFAAGEGSSALAAVALEELCRSYWFPVYAYLRRSGQSPHDAEDLTQGFLASIIRNGDLAAATPARGRFRSFLLGALRHFLSDERKKARAQKRGGGQAVISLDMDTAESRYRIEAVDRETPETQFERHWGRLVLERAMNRLRKLYEARGRAAVFDALQACLGGAGLQASHAEIGRRLHLSEGAIKVAIHRLRLDFGRVLRSEIEPTVGNSAEIDEEIRVLIRAIAP